MRIRWDIPEMIAQLRAKGLKVVLATDNMDTFHRWTVPSLQLMSLFDDILSSFQLKALKSDCGAEGRSLFFAHYLQTHSIHRGESLVLDDCKF
jgi:FMN phosphatase YigB (HAD superfamily)